MPHLRQTVAHTTLRYKKVRDVAGHSLEIAGQDDNANINTGKASNVEAILRPFSNLDAHVSQLESVAAHSLLENQRSKFSLPPQRLREGVEQMT
jgi:hypothetical protein